MSQEKTDTLQSQTYNRSKMWQIMLFTMNNTSTNIYLFSYAFVSYYAAGIIGLAVLFVGSLLGGVRFFDGAIDPAIGIFIDKTETKFGKYRPIILLGNVITALSFVLLFSTHMMPTAIQIFMLIVSLIVHKIGYSFQASVTKAGQTVLTNDPQQRPLFALFDGIFNIGVFTGGQIFISKYLVAKHGGFTTPFFAELSTIAIALSFTLAVLACIGIARKDRKEFFGLGEGTVETKGLREYWQVIKKNRPLQWLCFAASMDKLAVTLLSDAVIVVMLSFIGMGVLLFSLDDAAATFTGFGFPVILFIILYSAARSFGRTPTTLVIPMTADVSDYETSESGRYVAGIIGTIFSFIDSLAASMGPVLVGWLSAWMGYANAFPTAESPLTPALYTGTLVAVSVVPAALMFLSLMGMKFYSLDDKKMEKIQVNIAKKKMEVQEAKVASQVGAF